MTGKPGIILVIAALAAGSGSLLAQTWPGLEVILVDNASTDGSVESAQRRFGDRIVTIRNGSDETPLPSGSPATRFSIRFAGSIYLDRDPRLVFRAAAQVVRELGLTPDTFGFSFMGEVASFGGMSLQAIAREEGIEAFVEVMPPRPRSIIGFSTLPWRGGEGSSRPPA